LVQTNTLVNCKIYRELPNGQFSTTPEVNVNATNTLMNSTQEVLVSFGLANATGTNFKPLTYGMLSDSAIRKSPQTYTVPLQFSTMAANVTPKYKIVISVGQDEDNTNNSTQKIVRFYINQAASRILLAAENSMTNITSASTPDQIAGNLNYDSLQKGLNNLGWYYTINSTKGNYYNLSVFSYDIFDRLGWEPKAVDYSNYSTIFWSDGNDKAMTRLERDNIRNYMNLGVAQSKKSFIIGSQELVRKISAADATRPDLPDLSFVNDYFQAIDKAPSNPLGLNGNNNNNSVMGISLARGLSTTIKSTMFTNDPPPYCGLMGVNAIGQGLATPAYKYVNRIPSATDSIMGVAATSVEKNNILLGVDWRHWANITDVLRGTLDYLLKNGWSIVPVELISFEAIPLTDKISIDWTTASEVKTSKFEVEKAIKTGSVTSVFSKIAEEPAAGKSSYNINYGPVIDKDVRVGTKYVYRLKMIDVSGEFKYSDAVEAELSGSDAASIDVFGPNPANDMVNIEFSVNLESNYTISLIDMSGKTLLTTDGFTSTGLNKATLELSQISSGSYTVIIRIGEITLSRQLNVVK
jgi:hypothetical protein